MDELSKSAQDVVSKAYEQSQGAQGAQRPGGAEGGAAKGGDEPDDGGEYIDAEYDKK